MWRTYCQPPVYNNTVVQCDAHNVRLLYIITQLYVMYILTEDLTIVSQHPRVDDTAVQLQEYLRRLEEHGSLPTDVSRRFTVPPLLTVVHITWSTTSNPQSHWWIRPFLLTKTRTYLALPSTGVGLFANTRKILTPKPSQDWMWWRPYQALNRVLDAHNRVLGQFCMAAWFGSVSHAGVAENAELGIAYTLLKILMLF